MFIEQEVYIIGVDLYVIEALVLYPIIIELLFSLTSEEPLLSFKNGLSDAVDNTNMYELDNIININLFNTSLSVCYP